MGKDNHDTPQTEVPLEEVGQDSQVKNDPVKGEAQEPEPAGVKRLPFFIGGVLVGMGAATAGVAYLSDHHPDYLAKLGVVQPVLEVIEQKVEPQVQPTVKPMISEQDKQLLRSVLTNTEGLSEELRSVAQLQQSLSQARLSMEALQLRDRLSWISNPSYHLPQIRLAWQEIALLPSLNSEQRAHAEQMQQMAQSALELSADWQQRLLDVSMLLEVNESHNIIPETEYPWLNWVLDKFSLSPALDDQQKQMDAMRQGILQVRQDLSMEIWPDASKWRKLRAEVQLFLADRTDGQNSSELGVPESFDGIQSDITTLRQAAKEWMGQL